VAARRSSQGGLGLAIDDHMAPRSALLPTLATDRGAVVWHAKAEARRAARALHEAVTDADARTSEEFCGQGYGNPITRTVDGTQTVDSRNAESATASVGRAAPKALRWSQMGAFDGIITLIGRALG